MWDEDTNCRVDFETSPRRVSTLARDYYYYFFMTPFPLAAETRAPRTACRTLRRRRRQPRPLRNAPGRDHAHRRPSHAHCRPGHAPWRPEAINTPRVTSLSRDPIFVSAQNGALQPAGDPVAGERSRGPPGSRGRAPRLVARGCGRGEATRGRVRRPRPPAAVPAYLSRAPRARPAPPGPEVKASPRRPAVKSEAPAQPAAALQDHGGASRLRFGDRAPLPPGCLSGPQGEDKVTRWARLLMPLRAPLCSQLQPRLPGPGIGRCSSCPSSLLAQEGTCRQPRCRGGDVFKAPMSVSKG